MHVTQMSFTYDMEKVSLSLPRGSFIMFCHMCIVISNNCSINARVMRSHPLSYFQWFSAIKLQVIIS